MAPTDPQHPPKSYGPPLALKALVVGLVGAAVALTLELTFAEAVAPRWWRSLGIGVGLGLGYLAYEIWLGKRRRMIAEGRNPDDPRA